jgi:hypothetical protein
MTQRVDHEEDTGDLGVAAASGGGLEATAAYAELAELDSEPARLEADAPATESFGNETLLDIDDYEPAPRRSVGRRVLGWILGLLFLAAGVALGLYIGMQLGQL